MFTGEIAMEIKTESCSYDMTEYPRYDPHDDRPTTGTFFRKLPFYYVDCKVGGYVIVLVCVFVCLYVCQQEFCNSHHRFHWNLKGYDQTYKWEDYLLVLIQSAICIMGYFSKSAVAFDTDKGLE